MSEWHDVGSAGDLDERGVLLARVGGRRGGRPAQYVSAERRVLHCPWHGWEFDLDSGRCPDDERMRVAVYPVKIESGRVLIDA